MRKPSNSIQRDSTAGDRRISESWSIIQDSEDDRQEMVQDKDKLWAFCLRSMGRGGVLYLRLRDLVLHRHIDSSSNGHSMAAKEHSRLEQEQLGAICPDASAYHHGKIT